MLDIPEIIQHAILFTVLHTAGMPFHRFDPDCYYRAKKYHDEPKQYKIADPALAVIATRGTLAHWRCHGAGPRYVRFGHRVLYRGADLNAWLDAHVVEALQPPDRG